MRKNVLVTGMSGVGKSTLAAELSARGYLAIDADHPDWSTWAEADPHSPFGPPVGDGVDWVWREDRVAELLSGDHELLFFFGCAENMAKFYGRFDLIVLLSAPFGVIRARLRQRADNAFGSGPGDIDRVELLMSAVEPLLRQRAALEIDTRLPLDGVVARLLQAAASL